MIGFVRFEARYAVPMSRMNCAGEWVCRGACALVRARVGERAADDLDPWARRA